MLIFVLQAIWLYIKELAGKDLDVLTILKFLFYVTPTLIPLILPLTILLSSIMVFGNFAENYEFAAMKSTGISLQRAMASLSVFIVLLSIVTFFFSNNVIPWAQYESVNLRKNIAKVKPAMAIAEGQFNQIGDDFNIKVAKKTGDRGQFLEEIIIHQAQKRKIGNHKTIVAKSGELVSSEKSDVLKLVLYDGYYYDDTPPNKVKSRKKKPFVKSEFKEYTMNLDLSQLNKVDLDDKDYKNKYTMLNIKDLKYTTDSLIEKRHTKYEKFSNALYNRTNIATLNLTVNSKKDSVYNGNIIDLFKTKRQVQLIDYAINSISSTNQMITTKQNKLKAEGISINRHIMAFHEKFALSIACIILFFVGAPLGALIRKGGLGLPMVIAIVLFLSYHFIGIFATNSAKDGTINPILAAWFSTLIMLPLSIYLTHRATNDRGLLETDGLLEPLKKFFKLKSKKTEFNTKVFTINSEAYKTLESLESNKLIEIVKDYRSFDYSVQHKNTAISVLTSRGITRQELKMAGHLNNDFFEEAVNLKNNYVEDSKLAFILYAIGVLLISGGRVLINNEFPIIGNVLFLIGILAFIVFIFALIKSFSKHTNLYKHLGKNNSINGVIFSLLGLPVYFIFYFIQRFQITKDLNAIQFNNRNNTKSTSSSSINSTNDTITKEKTIDFINEPVDDIKKGFIKACVGTLVLALIFVVLHFVFANNKSPQLASAVIQLSVVSFIVSLFYVIKTALYKSKTTQKNTISKDRIKTINGNTNFKKTALIALVFAMILVLVYFISKNNNAPVLASSSIQLSIISLIVSVFYFVKSKL